MADAGVVATEKLIKELEKDIKREYKKAGKEVKKRLDDYLKKFEEEDKKMAKALKNKEITKRKYTQWRTSQMLTTKRWTELSERLAKEYTGAAQTAMRLTSGTLKDVYAINHNFGTFEAEKGALLNTNYTLYDRTTVEKLIKENPKLIPEPKVDIPKDLRWNQRRITSAVTQGILQGDPIDRLAGRIAKVTDMDSKAAIRSARTMITSAQNAGRVDSYHRAEEMGIEMMQVWLATLDERTRYSHAMMNGEMVEVGEEFSNGLKYPADPDGEPEEVYNCRCTLVARVQGIKLGMGSVDDDYIDENYGSWLEKRAKWMSQMADLGEL